VVREINRRFRTVDVIIGDLIIERKVKVRAVRTLNESIFQLTQYMAEESDKRGCLLLINAGVTPERVHEEWQRATRILRPEILNRLMICLYEDGELIGIPEDPSPSDRGILLDYVKQESDAKEEFHLLKSPDRYYDVLRYLINKWALNRGPQSPTVIAKRIGCSYPTVAEHVDKLGAYIARSSDRKVKLKAFPKDEWFRLVANASEVRQTMYFCYKTENRKSVESLLKRWTQQNTHRRDFALGGVPGAKFYFPDTDIVGTPRLDVTVNCSDKTLDFSFLRRIDPGLQPCRPEEKPVLAVHAIIQKEPLFKKSKENFFVADPVECLLDLHEMRFESQVKEIIQKLPFDDDHHKDHDHNNEEDNE